MTDLNKLPLEQIVVLQSLDELGGSVDEHTLHLMMSVAESIASEEDRQYNDYEEYTIWGDVLGKQYGEVGVSMYSKKLHDAVESLVKLGLVIRDAEKPLNLKLA